MKLTDCALARDLFPSDYHCLGDNENRPIKWLALESLTHKVFTPAADVVGVIFNKDMFVFMLNSAKLFFNVQKSYYNHVCSTFVWLYCSFENYISQLKLF